jgi:hypothetical protein
MHPALFVASPLHTGQIRVPPSDLGRIEQVTTRRNGMADARVAPLPSSFKHGRSVTQFSPVEAKKTPGNAVLTDFPEGETEISRSVER